MSEQNNQNNNEQEQYSAPVSSFLDDVVNSEKSQDAAGTEKENAKEDTKKEKTHKEKNAANSKKLRHGMMSTALTVVFIAVVVMINIVATVLFDRYPITIDLTKDNIYSISEESEEYVKKIDTDVIITVFAEEDTFTGLSTYTKQAVEVMKKYSQYNSRISYRFVDIDSNPDIVSEYEADSVSDLDIIVETNPAENIKSTTPISAMRVRR